MDTSTICIQSKKKEVFDKSLDIRLKQNHLIDCINRGLIHLFIFLVMYYFIKDWCPNYAFSRWYYFKVIATYIFGILFMFYLLKFMYCLYTFRPVEGTKEQKKLLEFADADTSFVVADKLPCTDTSTQSANGNVTILSWHSSFNDSNRSIIGSSQVYNRTTPTGNPQNTSWNPTMCNSSLFNLSTITNPSLNSSFSSPYKKYLEDEIITDEEGLQKYLRKVSRQEQNVISEAHGGAQSSLNQQSINNSFWTYCNSAAHLLKTTLYQLSPTTTPVSPIKQSGIGTGNFEGAPEVLKKLSPAKLSQYVANLRIWISITILQRLDCEINNIDESFRSRGFSDLQIGSVGLERLKKTAENQQFVSAHVPMLPLIVPFLEMSTNQEYLVQRIKDLSKGSCLTDYRWDSGSSYHGLNWDEHLPTDSAIIFHLFCTYLDTQLMPLPQPGGRPFFTRYVVLGDKKSAKDTIAEVNMKNKAKCAILCTNQLKPKFNFISDDKIHNCPYDRNNLFYVIIQFLFYMKNNHGGLLEGVYLGKSGINILCVIED